MATYGYTILFSTSTFNKTTLQPIVKQLIDNKSSKIQNINSILRKQFDNQCYNSHLDHLMLFSVEFMNIDTRTHYSGLYIISLAEIDNPLFINNKQLETLLNSNHKITVNDIYCTHPSFRFNKFHSGDFFHLEQSNQIVINTQQTNSHGLVRC